MTYLMIENSGVAPIEAYTLLGMSSTRNCGVDGAIGQFGSGNKHAINVLLREDVDFKIYSGLTQLNFSVEDDKIADGLTVTDTQKVKCQLKGGSNRTIDCGWCLDFGAMTWNKIDMALREFVSNALDRTLRETGGFTEGLVIEEVDKPRAKAGTTRVFVEIQPVGIFCDVRKYLMELGSHFLHFSGNPEQVNQRFINKVTSGGPRIYREGVYIRTMESKHRAVFDYNFSAKDIEIDECRNSSEYALRATISQLINKAETETIAKLFEEMCDGDTFESDLDDYYLSYHTGDQYKQNWQEAWEQVAGDAVVVAENKVEDIVQSLAKNKGFELRSIRSQAFTKVAETMGIVGIASAVGEQVISGRVEQEASEELLTAVDGMWGMCQRAGVTQERPYPDVTAYSSTEKIPTNGHCPFGEDRIMIREDLSGHDLNKAILEQLGQHICGRFDVSGWALDLALKQQRTQVA